jgi:hypothetical protein
MGLFSRRDREPDRDRLVISIRGDADGEVRRDPSDPGVLSYQFQTDKEYDRHGLTGNHEYVYTFTDGSWANATTGEVFDATGDGFLYGEPHWCQ